MLIVCPTCATSYRVDPSSLGTTGRSVRCVRCRTVWFARDPGGLAAVADRFRGEVTAMTGAHEEAPPPDAAATLADVETPPAHAIAAPPEAEPQQATAFDLQPPPDAAAAPAHDPTALPEHGMLRAEAPPIVADAPPLAPIRSVAIEPLADATIGGDIETIAALKAKARARHRFSLSAQGLPAVILALLTVNAILIGWRADVVKILPQTASLYAAIGLPVNLRGLTFADVKTVTEMQEGVAVLVVEGTIASASKYAVEVPRLRFAARNAKGQEVYSWTALPARGVLAPGETIAFRSRLASPPPETSDVTVRFFSRRDRLAGIQ
jgi:predicted Zn finger-like uncharacterized protein